MENKERKGNEGKPGKAERRRLSRKLQRRPKTLKVSSPGSSPSGEQEKSSYSESLHWRRENDARRWTAGLVVMDSRSLPRSQQMLESRSQKMTDQRSPEMTDPGSQQMSESRNGPTPDPGVLQMSDLRLCEMPESRVPQLDYRWQHIADSRSLQKLNDTPGCSSMTLNNVESSDDAYFSEISSETSVKSYKAQTRDSRASLNQKHLKITRKQSSITDSSLLASPTSNEAKTCLHPTTIKSETASLNTKIVVPKELIVSKSISGCHCQACCSCHGNVSSGGCVHHPKACKKCSDSTSADNSQVTEADTSASLPSPTSITSWGHFCKTTQNCYKYRRSDYSSDSEDDIPMKKDKNSASQMPLLCHQKSHLPKLMVTLSRQSSASSTKSARERSGSGISDANLPVNDGVPPADFKDRITVSTVNVVKFWSFLFPFL